MLIIHVDYTCWWYSLCNFPGSNMKRPGSLGLLNVYMYFDMFDVSIQGRIKTNAPFFDVTGTSATRAAAVLSSNPCNPTMPPTPWSAATRRPSKASPAARTVSMVHGGTRWWWYIVVVVHRGGTRVTWDIDQMMQIQDHLGVVELIRVNVFSSFSLMFD